MAQHGTRESTAGLNMERIVRNDAIFREANEGIRSAAERHQDREDHVPLPFICECADENCTEIIQVTLEQYRDLRSDPRLFLNVPGHQASAQGWAAAIAAQNGYIVVEKLGPAGDLAEELVDQSLLPPRV